MSYTIVITAGQLSGSDITRSITAFSALTTPAFVGTKMEALSEIIDSYKKGTVDTEAFFKTLQVTLQEGSEKEVTIEAVVRAWNVMSVIDDTVIDDLKALEGLQEKLGFDVVVIGRTNEAHFEFEKQQLSDAKVELKVTRINSFEHGTLDANTLLSHADLDREDNVVICFIKDISVVICFIKDISLEFERAKLVMNEVTDRGLSVAVETGILSDMPRLPLVRLSSKDRYGFSDIDDDSREVVASVETGETIVAERVAELSEDRHEGVDDSNVAVVGSPATRRLSSPKALS